MKHPPAKFPHWRSASRAAVSDTYRPFSPYCMVSLAKVFRGEAVIIGNEGPLTALRNRPGVAPKPSHGGTPRHHQHPRGCSCCHPRQGRPRLPYKRAAGRWVVDVE